MQRVEQQFWKSAEVARLLELVESERRYFQQILASLPVAVAVAAADGSLRAANHAFRGMFALPPDGVAQARVQDLFPGCPVAGWIADVTDTGVSIEDCELMTGEGPNARHFLLMLDPAPAWRDGGQPEVLLTVLELGREEDASLAEKEPLPEPEAPPPPPPAVSFQDIEQAKRAAIERLAARVAHVANNLLMIIGGYGEEILESLPEGDVRRAGMAEILRAAERLARITKDLNALTVAREYLVETLDLRQWLDARKADWAQWCVDVEIPEAGLCALVSTELLEQILVEASRYLCPALGESTRPRLRTVACGADRVQFRIEWPAAVLSEEARERFFEPFSGEKVGADPPVGIAAHIKSWEKIGGAMALEDHAFVLECPRAPSAAPLHNTILLVDDEPGIRSLIARALEREGFTVLQAGSAQEALEAWQDRTSAPAVLVTDLTMPGISGKELAERLRLRWPDLPVLFISGYTADQQLAVSTAPDAKTRFLHKPFTIQRLLAVVAELLKS